VLEIELGDLSNTVRAKRGQRLPVVLSQEEVAEMFKHTKGLNLLILQLLYGSGMRLMELARLRVKDIDFDSNLIFVRDSKGNKDRTTMLPESVKTQLRLHIEKVKELHEKDLKSGYGEVYLLDALGRKYPNAAKEWCWQYVFPSAKLSVDPRSGKVRRHDISEKTVQRIVSYAAKKANISKHVTVHTLRHSFATHLLMSGLTLEKCKNCWGIKMLRQRWFIPIFLREMSSIPRSPLDNLLKI